MLWRWSATAAIGNNKELMPVETTAAAPTTSAAPSAAQLHYSLIVEWDPRDAIYVVTVPELPGCRTHGRTYEEAIAMAQEAIEGWVETAAALGWAIPAPRHYPDRPLIAQ